MPRRNPKTKEKKKDESEQQQQENGNTHRRTSHGQRAHRAKDNHPRVVSETQVSKKTHRLATTHHERCPGSM